MAIVLSCRDLAKSYGPRPLFENLSLGLFDGERTGLIGPNGAGKSTLLKIFAGLETPDGGELSLRRGLKVRYLAQKDAFEQATTNGTVQEVLVQALQGLGLEDYEIDMRVEAALENSGFSPDHHINRLSGGWRKRLAILSQVIVEPDLLLLDEPTNHLDVEGVRWLEHFLSGLRFSFLVITHDRRFLDAVCSRIIELNPRYEEGHFSSTGNYTRFLENREAHFTALAAREDSMRNTVRREKEWLARGPQARTTKQKARIDRAEGLIQELGQLSSRNAMDRSASINFSSGDRKTKRLIEAMAIGKSLGGKKLFGPLSLFLTPGDKLGLLGGNGSGKSTLLKILSGQLEPDSGSLKKADGLRVVVFDQHREQLDLSLPLRRALCDSGEIVKYKDSTISVAGWAERFLFSRDQLDREIGKMSGGEQSRVLIARLMLRPADVLLLDEPTNDLDINSLEVLESSLVDFTGALVLVTHDRYLLDRVSDRLLFFDGKGHAHEYADLAQWESLVIEKEHSAEAPLVEDTPTKRVTVTAPATDVKKSLSAKEVKELKNVEANLRAAEDESRKAVAALSDPSIASDAAELLSRQNAVDAAQNKVDELYERWGDLESRK